MHLETRYTNASLEIISQIKRIRVNGNLWFGIGEVISSNLGNIFIYSYRDFSWSSSVSVCLKIIPWRSTLCNQPSVSYSPSESNILFSIVFSLLSSFWKKKAYEITFLSMCLPPNVARQHNPGPLLGNDLLNTFRRHWIYTHKQKKSLTRCFLWGPCRIKYSIRNERKIGELATKRPL
jgi:hypothetical protein